MDDHYFQKDRLQRISYNRLTKLFTSNENLIKGDGGALEKGNVEEVIKGIINSLQNMKILKPLAKRSLNLTY